MMYNANNCCSIRFGKMKKKKVTFSAVCLEPKIIEQVKLCFFNKAILNEIDRFNKLSEKEEFLLQISQDFQSFLANYKQTPEDELINLFSLQTNEIHSAYNSRDTKILIDKLLIKNKSLKKQIIDSSLKPIAEPWIELFKTSMLDFLKWGPTTLIVIGFIKALILSDVLGFSLSTLFSLQDYWDYGISDTGGFMFGIIGLFGSFYSQFYLAEFAGFNYIKPAEIRYQPIVKLPNFSTLFFPNIIITILTIISFSLPCLFPRFIELSLAILLICLLYFPFLIISLINKYTYNILVKLSITFILVITISNLWFIPKTVNPEFPEFHSKTIINSNIDLPSDTFYVDSSTKYHIFSDGQKTYLIPSSNVNYITR